MRDLIPDSPKEFSFIAASIARLGAAMSGVTLFQEHRAWTLTAILLTWVGYEISSYINLHFIESDNQTKNQNDTDANS